MRAKLCVLHSQCFRRAWWATLKLWRTHRTAASCSPSLTHWWATTACPQRRRASLDWARWALVFKTTSMKKDLHLCQCRVQHYIWQGHTSNTDSVLCVLLLCVFVQWFESSKIHAAALIIGQLSESPSHWSSVKSLDQWLKEQGIPGIQG